MPDQRPTLLAILVDRDEHTLSEIVEKFERCARDNNEDATLSVRTLRRWIAGDVRTEPRPSQRRVARQLWGFPMSQLLAPSPGELVPTPAAVERSPESLNSRPRPIGLVGPPISGASSGPDRFVPSRAQIQQDSVPFRGDAQPWRSMPAGHGEAITASEWPVWFGIRLAHLLGVVDSWQGPNIDSEALQDFLHQEILMFDAIAPDDQNPDHALSRRQALVTLTALPLTVAAGTLSHAAAAESFVSRCAASLAACWHLLRGSDLYTVDQMLSPYLLELEGIAQRQSVHRETAARLASQAHRICGIIALHRNQLRMREYHCKQALHYAGLTPDLNSRVSAMVSLASTYFYDAAPARAADVYEQALTFEPAMSPLQRSRVHAELSVVYGQLGRERETLRSIELAESLYPGEPEQDRSFLYADVTRASLTLEQGLSYVALAERFPGRAYQRKAADIFARMERAASTTVPDRIRFEIINHQARTAVLLNDLDGFEIYLDRGVEGVIQLGSKQRQKEVQIAWQRASETWGNEPRLKAIGGRLQPVMTRVAMNTDMPSGWN